MSRRLAVIGGTGFVGRAVADAAQRQGWRAHLLAPESPPGAARQAADVPHLDCDVTDPDSLDAALSACEPTAVVHCAAFGSGADGLLAGAAQAPRRAVEVNVGGFVTVVEATQRAGLDRLVWASSTTVYGPPSRYERQPVPEDVVLAPQTIYGATKAAAELLAPSLEARTGVRAVALRLPLVYGPGRWYGGSQAGLVQFVEDIAAGRPAQLAASEQPADWIYIDDAAAAFLSALTAPDPACAYNLVGHRSSLADVGRALVEHADASATVTTDHVEALALPAVSDEAARRDLGFTPRFALATAAGAYIRYRKEEHVHDR